MQLPSKTSIFWNQEEKQYSNGRELTKAAAFPRFGNYWKKWKNYLQTLKYNKINKDKRLIAVSFRIVAGENCLTVAATKFSG